MMMGQWKEDRSVPEMRVRAVFDGDAVGKIEGIVDVEFGQG